MIYDKMPECEFGANCTIPGCIYKHPPPLQDVCFLVFCVCRENACSTSRDFVPTVSDVSVSKDLLLLLHLRHIRYEDGSIPVTVDISCRNFELGIDPKVYSLKRLLV